MRLTPLTRMMLLMKTRVIALATTALLWALPATAQLCTTNPIVTGAVDFQGSKIHGSNQGAQTFLTAGTSADCVRLNQVTVQACKGGTPPGNLVLEIRNVTSGVPGSSVGERECGRSRGDD